MIQECADDVAVRGAGHYWRWYGFTKARTEVMEVSLTYCVRITFRSVTLYDFICSYAIDFSLSEVIDAPWDKVGATGHWTGSGGRLFRLNIQTQNTYCIETAAFFLL